MLEDFFESEFFMIRNFRNFSLNKKILEKFLRTNSNTKEVFFHNFIVNRFIIKNIIIYFHGVFCRINIKKSPRYKFVLYKNSKKTIFRFLINCRIKNITGNDNTNLPGKPSDIRLEMWWDHEHTKFENFEKNFLDCLFFKKYNKCMNIINLGRFLNKNLRLKPKNNNVFTTMNFILNFK
jgi:hypothetical protein